MINDIESPCIQVCKYDVEDICQGCYRSMEEITGWIFMDREQKRIVLENARTRKGKIKTEKNDFDYYV